MAEGAGACPARQFTRGRMHEHYIPSQHHAHLKLSINGYTCTSIGLIIKKPARGG